MPSEERLTPQRSTSSDCWWYFVQLKQLPCFPTPYSYIRVIAPQDPAAVANSLNPSCYTSHSGFRSLPRPGNFSMCTHSPSPINPVDATTVRQSLTHATQPADVMTPESGRGSSFLEVIFSNRGCLFKKKVSNGYKNIRLFLKRKFYESKERMFLLSWLDVF